VLVDVKDIGVTTEEKKRERQDVDQKKRKKERQDTHQVPKP
jgi:hypothetical protein